MEPILGQMRETLDTVRPGVASTPLYSTVTGRREPGPHLSRGILVPQCPRDPVFFTDALSAMLADGYNTFLEIGPHPLLIHGSEAPLFQKSRSRRDHRPVDDAAANPEVMIFLQKSLHAWRRAEVAPDTTAIFRA